MAGESTHLYYDLYMILGGLEDFELRRSDIKEPVKVHLTLLGRDAGSCQKMSGGPETEEG